MVDDIHMAVEVAIGTIAIFIALFTAYGGIMKYNYDKTKKIDQLLYGSNGDEGLVEEIRNSNHEVGRSQREIERTLRAHGALLQELVYTLHKLAEEADSETDMGELDMRRLEHLEETLRRDDDIQDYSPNYSSDARMNGGVDEADTEPGD